MRLNLSELNVTPEALAGLCQLADSGRLTSTGAKAVLAKMIETGRGAPALVEEMGLEVIGDDSELDGIVNEAVAASPGPVAAYLKGKDAALGAIVGQAMRLTRGRAEPEIVRGLLRTKLDARKEQDDD